MVVAADMFSLLSLLEWLSWTNHFLTLPTLSKRAQSCSSTSLYHPPLPLSSFFPSFMLQQSAGLKDLRNHIKKESTAACVELKIGPGHSGPLNQIFTLEQFLRVLYLIQFAICSCCQILLATGRNNSTYDNGE